MSRRAKPSAGDLYGFSPTAQVPLMSLDPEKRGLVVGLQFAWAATAGRALDLSLNQMAWLMGFGEAFLLVNPRLVDGMLCDVEPIAQRHLPRFEETLQQLRPDILTALAKSREARS